MGFDQPIILLKRQFGLGQAILDHWLSFIPLALLLTVGALGGNLLLYHQTRQLHRRRAGTRVAAPVLSPVSDV
jgi:hypothetical protein